MSAETRRRRPTAIWLLQLLVRTGRLSAWPPRCPGVIALLLEHGGSLTEPRSVNKAKRMNYGPLSLQRIRSPQPPGCGFWSGRNNIIDVQNIFFNVVGKIRVRAYKEFEVATVEASEPAGRGKVRLIAAYCFQEEVLSFCIAFLQLFVHVYQS